MAAQADGRDVGRLGRRPTSPRLVMQQHAREGHDKTEAEREISMSRNAWARAPGTRPTLGPGQRRGPAESSSVSTSRSKQTARSGPSSPWR